MMKKRIISILVLLVVLTSVLVVPMSAGAASTEGKAGQVAVSYGRLNVRSEASQSSARLTTLSNGTYITLLSKSGSWWYAEYNNGKYGYLHSDYIKELSSTKAAVSISYGTLNVRSGAGTSFGKIDSLKNGKNVMVLSDTDGWSRILYDGSKTGYVSSKYLTIDGAKYPAISLNVPSFKQTDSRWANVKLGSSGKTISQIGCATTAIAMVESYRTGTTVYPDAMSKKLKYTSSGNVYWPSNYIQDASISSYKTKIYNILKSGKPVLIGLKNKYGAQHWVVITGYKGGDTIKASSFIINDPGSKTRDDLQDFINVYPYFYKYIYY